jgi:hypothetical protein
MAMDRIDGSHTSRTLGVCISFLSWPVLALFLGQHVAHAQLVPGEIIIGANIGASTSSPDYGLLAIDPTTGNRTIIADNTHGTGPALEPPTSVTLASDGSLLVAWDNGTQGPGLLYRVDPATGNRTIISSGSTNAGPASTYIGARQFGDSILMSGGPIVSVDPTTGTRTLVSGTGLGTGESMNSVGFAISGTNLFVTNSQANDILQVDTLTGNRTVVSSASIGTGPSFAGQGVEFDRSGHLLVSAFYVNAQSQSLPAIFSVDPLTGNRSIVTGDGVGTGPALGLYIGQVGVASNNNIFVSSLALTVQQLPILSVDPATGNRTILSDATHGTGPLFDPTTALMVVPTPEPSTIILAALSGLVLLACRRRGR